MEIKKSTSYKAYLAVLFTLGWFALILQFVLYINSNAASKLELIIRFFSFFTIDSNLIIAICSTILLFTPKSAIGNFFSKSGTLTALAVYIVVVAFIYNTTLRSILILSGWDAVANELLHVIIPMLYVIFWILFVSKTQLKYREVWPWLIYPAVYTLFVFVRGIPSNYYPYPFMNVNHFGVERVIINCFFVCLAFILLSFAFVALGKRFGR